MTMWECACRGNCRQLFIGNLGPYTEEDNLIEAFRAYNCVHVKLSRDYMPDKRHIVTGESNG